MWMFSRPYSALCGAILHVSICLHMHRSQLGTLTNASYLWYAFFGFFTGNPHRQLIVSCIFFPSTLFHFALECLLCGVKKSCRIEHCYRAALWNAPSPNLILALLKIVCIPNRTDRPLFRESHCCPGRWKRPLCASSTEERPHEIFTGQHLVWDQERGAGGSTTLLPKTARPQL